MARVNDQYLRQIAAEMDFPVQAHGRLSDATAEEILAAAVARLRIQNAVSSELRLHQLGARDIEIADEPQLGNAAARQIVPGESEERSTPN